MTAGAPWSVKGIDPKAREVAKELARRSGMTLGEWLNRVILEDDLPEEIASEDQFGARWRRPDSETPKSLMPPPPIISPPMGMPSLGGRTDELGRIAFALDRLTDRIEASETRTGLAISGVEHSVRHAMARIETAEREHMAVATRFDAAAERLDAEQVRAAERLRQVEEQAGPRSSEALAMLEARISQTEAKGAEGADPSVVIEEVVAKLGQRLADAEGRTGDALESLRGSLAELDERMRRTGAEARPEFDRRMEALADDLTARVEAARSEIADKLAATSPGHVEARLDRMVDEVAAVEQRSARAIETMGREVLTMAETLNRRVHSAEQRSAEAIEQVGGEIARIAGAVETRLGRVDQLHAEALERLGAEIGRITERLTDRIIASERRAAQAIDDVGEQVAAVTERIEQRHERASSDLAERLRQSEERTAKLLSGARAHLEDDTPPAVETDAPDAHTFDARTFEAQTFEAQTFEAGSWETQALEAEILEAETSALAALDDQPEFVAEPEMAAPEEAAEQSILAATVEPEAEVEAPLPLGVFGADLLARAEPMIQPVLDPANPAFGAEDFEAADGFVSLSDDAEAFAPLEERPDTDDHDPAAEPGLHRFDTDAPPAEKETSTLSTREVIEQARATARAAAAAPRPPQIHAGDRRPRQPRGGLFSALRARPATTWQTALMVAGGAAFLSVGAAGVVLIEGPGVPREETQDASAYVGDPRAALALSPQSATALPADAADTQPVAASAPTPAIDPAAADFVAVTQAVERKEPGALARLKVMAEGGSAPAQTYLARLYETGHASVVQNFTEARRWTARAADAGDPAAMHNLALYYFRGEGGPPDAAAAAQWFKKAAEHGVVDSQYNLGLLYQSGSGVPRDLTQAYKWFQIAANAGDSEARASAMDLEAKLPAAKLAQAESQAGAFQPQGAIPPGDTVSIGPSVVTAQKVLSRLGYYKGRVDGATTRDLKLAVSAYQRDQGLAATGSLDPATVSRLAVFSR
jgi:localization factor PodJL